MIRWTIRWRLTLWNLVALAAVLLGFAGLVYGLVAHTLYENIDRSLSAGAQLLEHDSRLSVESDSRLRYLIHELHEHQNLTCVVYADDGSVIERTEVLAAESAPPTPGPDAGRTWDAMLPLIGRQRALTTRIRVGDRDLRALVLAPLADVDHELGHVTAAVTWAIPAALLVAGGLGYVLARRALAPVDRLRAMTEEVTADRLDRRLPVANPHDELGRLALTINAMIGRLEQSFSEVRRFTADASHELRTPLAVLRTEAELALARSDGRAEQQQLLGSILEECERLTKLTDQLLTLSREDAGVAKANREPVDLSSLVRDVADTLSPLAEAGQIRLEVRAEHPAIVRGDAARLRRVFVNLLDNALKYTPHGGAVNVELSVASGCATVDVRDTGAGIPPEHLPHVFERFYRVDKARAREQGGTGLGLSIARSIVTAHGGRIELASTPRAGTVCTVTLPLEESH
jgi:heavy metal sensor kinase